MKKNHYNSLVQASKFDLPKGINLKIRVALEELEKDEQYAADELVDLAEEILNQIAAVGFIHYLKNGVQKEGNQLLPPSINLSLCNFFYVLFRFI